jgi:hypothetical protein
MRFKITHFKADGSTATGVVDDATNVLSAVQQYLQANQLPLIPGEEFRASARVKVSLSLADAADA